MTVKERQIKRKMESISALLRRLRQNALEVDRHLAWVTGFQQALMNRQKVLLERKLFHEMRLGILQSKLADAKPQRR